MASKKKSRSQYEEEHNRRVRKVESDVKLRLDKHKHKLYDESSYESDDFYDQPHITKINRKHRT